MSNSPPLGSSYSLDLLSTNYTPCESMPGIASRVRLAKVITLVSLEAEMYILKEAISGNCKTECSGLELV